VKPHGLRGEVKVKSFLTEPEQVLPRVETVMATEGKAAREVLSLVRWRSQQGIILMEFQGVNDAERAGELVGSLLWGREECLAPLPEGEFYWRELLGMRVVTEEGEYLGELTSIFPTGSNDVYVCTSEQGEMLIPAIADCVRHIHKGERTMVVRLLAGLR